MKSAEQRSASPLSRRELLRFGMTITCRSALTVTLVEVAKRGVRKAEKVAKHQLQSPDGESAPPLVENLKKASSVYDELTSTEVGQAFMAGALGDEEIIYRSSTRNQSATNTTLHR